MITSPLISVVLPTYRRCASLRRAVVALLDQTLPPDEYEIIVIIDGSDDGTREMLVELRAPCRIVWRWQPNSGRSAACNAGISLAKGRLIVLLDDDMEPTPGFLEAHAAEHRSHICRAVVGAAPIVASDPPSAVTDYVRNKFQRHLELLASSGHTFALRDFYSGNMSIERSVLLQVGGFDEAFRIYGNEDLELSWRLRAAGVELAFSTTALAYQHYTKDFSALAQDNIAKGRTAVLLASKHPSALPQLKLSTHGTGPLWRRLAVRSLLAASTLWPQTPGVLIRATEVLGRLRLRGVSRLYGVVLDYCYFVGATAAREEAGRSRAGAGAG